MNFTGEKNESKFEFGKIVADYKKCIETKTRRHSSGGTECKYQTISYRHVANGKFVQRLMSTLLSFFLQPKSPEGVESPYFSPMKTRNARRHIKIQTEETLTKSPTSKIVSKAVVKQKTIDAVNAFAAATATKSKETIVSQKLKIEDDIDVNDIGKPVASKPKPKAKRNLKIENVAIKEEQSIPDENELVAEQFKLSKSKLKRKVKSEPGSIKDETVDAATKEPVAEEMKSPTKRSKQNAIKVAVDEIKMEATTADVEEAKWMPKNWQQLLENIREMRKSRPAPVDTMGCHKCSDDAAPENVSNQCKLTSLREKKNFFLRLSRFNASTTWSL